MKTANKVMATGMLTAFAASSCCITPFIVLLTGSSSLVSAFSWLEAARPFFIGFTLLTLAYAWLTYFRSCKKVNGACDTPSKPKFIQSKSFLLLLTFFTGLMLTFPLYSSLFYTTKNEQAFVPSNATIEQLELRIQGITCDACSQHITHEIDQLDGIIHADISYANQKAVIAFDARKLTFEEIQQAINAIGYPTQLQEK